MPAGPEYRNASLGWGACLIAYCGLIYWLSDQPSLLSPDLFDHEDKLVHAAAYGGMAWLFWQSWRRALADRPRLLMAATVIFCSLYGLGDEWHQSFVPGRDASLLDWLADTIGAILLLLLVRERKSR